MSARYPVFMRRITIDSTNNAIRMTENSVTQTVSIAAGTYYLGADNGECNDAADANTGALLEDAIVTALNTHTGGTNTYACAVSLSIDPANTAEQGTVTISRATGSNSFALLFANAATTFDPGLIGFPATDTADNTSAKTSTRDPLAVWVGSQPIVSFDPDFDREYAVTKPKDGAARSVDLGGYTKTRTIQFRYINGIRTNYDDLDQASVAAPGWEGDGSMAQFIQRCAANGRFIVYLLPLVSGYTLDTPNNSNTLSLDQNTDGSPGQWLFDEDTVRNFAPRRMFPGMDLYEFSVRIRRVNLP